VPVELVKGHHGQLDVMVGDRMVVSRKGGLFAKFTGKPWPDHADVVRAVRTALGAGAS